MKSYICGAAAIAIVIAAPAAVSAQTPRETLIRAAFMTHDKAEALTLVNQAYAQTRTTLAQSPNDGEAKLQQALAIGYRGQLSRSLGDAKPHTPRWPRSPPPIRATPRRRSRSPAGT